MRSALETAGFTIVPFRESADVYVINTCSVTNIADRKSRQMISRAKKMNPDAVVAAVGCYVQTALERTGKLVEADILIGSGRKGHLVEELCRYFTAMERAQAHDITGGDFAAGNLHAPFVGGAAGSSQKLSVSGAAGSSHGPSAGDAAGSSQGPFAGGAAGSGRQPSSSARGAEVRCVSDVMHEKEYEELSLPGIEGHTRAWIKVQDGCNMFCSYCIIPFARGRIRSRKMEDILEELRGLARQGVCEVVLTGIHLSSYGVDFAGGVDLAYGQNGEGKTWQEKSKLINLVEEVSRIEGIERIRLGSLEPTIITEEFVRRLSAVRQVCPHFHLSLQSGCDSVLKRMNRHYTTGEYMHCVELLRNAFDQPAITTDVITGFPGESPEEFECTRKFLENVHFYETHLFRYSMRAGTRAARMADQIPEQIKEERLNNLAQTDRRMRREFEASWDGKTVEVLFEELAQIDENGFVSIPNSGSARPGEKYQISEELQGPGQLYTGYTREYIRVYAKSLKDLRGRIVEGKLHGLQIQG